MVNEQGLSLRSNQANFRLMFCPRHDCSSGIVRRLYVKNNVQASGAQPFRHACQIDVCARQRFFGPRTAQFRRNCGFPEE